MNNIKQLLHKWMVLFQLEDFKRDGNLFPISFYMNNSKINTVIQHALATIGNPQSNQDNRIPMISAIVPAIGEMVD